ncbi:hypothetical protein J1N35_037731 [Gossypium stocksii]|uniref:Uncharacterized protein n=1 Tax=Gossypium stocksii TaxID=47602 RepID=A0A9D3UKL7_9ROSI|nr:hypothetical protein J1N35_037731 [Gossypium stocksii]
MSTEEELANLNIDEDEEVSVRSGKKEVDVGEDFNSCLVGRVLTESLVHFLSMKKSLTNLWHLLGGFMSEGMAQQFQNSIRQFVKFLLVKANARRSRGGVWLGKFIKGRAKKDNATYSLWLREELKEGIRVGGRSNRDRGSGYTVEVRIMAVNEANKGRIG